MIINDLDVVRVTVAPDNANAISVVNPNAVLASPVPLQPLQAVAGNYRQVAELMGGVQLFQLSLRDPGDPLKTTIGSSRE